MNSEENIDLIDFRSLINNFWKRRKFIIFLTSLGAIFSLIFALNQQNIYRSTSILNPTASLAVETQGISSLFSQVPAGLFPGSLNKDNKVDFAMEKMQSLDFFENLYYSDNFLVELYASKKWERDINQLFLDNRIYDSENNEWVRSVRGSNKKPTIQEAKKKFYESNFHLSKNKEKGFVYLSVDHISPSVAKKWNDLIVNNINSEIKQFDYSRTSNELDFLQNNMRAPKFAQVKDVLSIMVSQKINEIAIIESSPNYVFEYVQKGFIPERKHGPSRSLLCIAITLLFFLSSLLISAFLNLYQIDIRKIFRRNSEL